MTNTLILHADNRFGKGGQIVDRENLALVPTPDRTETFVPIAHVRMLDLIETAFAELGLEMRNPQHGLTSDGSRYFGVMEIYKAGNGNQDWCKMAAIRNAHDHAFSAALAFGNRVFCCDNLAFSGEIRFTRKHTTYIERDLPALVAKAVGMLATKWESQAKRFELYKSVELTEARVNDLLIRSMDLRVVSSTYLPKVLGEWRKPQHDEFAPRTVWSLYNAYTEVLKEVNMFSLPNRTIALTALMDSVTDFEPELREAPQAIGAAVLDAEIVEEN